MRKWIKCSTSIFMALTLSLNVFSVAKANEVVPISAPTIDESKEGISASLEKLAEEKANLLIEMYGVTSVQYALIDNGEITLSGTSGFYDKNKKVKPTKDNMYGIGSISKIYTTVATMKLAQEGKIFLDEKVTEYLPDFKMADERYKNITVRMLLNHSSGLRGSALDNAMLLGDNDTKNNEEFLKNLEKDILQCDPGEYSVYCNDGFMLAELIVEKITNKTFTQYLHDEILSPMGLNNTKTPQDKFDKSKMAKTYMPNFKMATPIDTLNAIGVGGIYSTAEDLCKFSQLFMENADVKLPTKILADMESAEYKKGIWPSAKDAVLRFGLGWDNVSADPFDDYQIKALTKGGDTYLYHGNLIVLPEENMAVAVLSSGGDSTVNTILGQEILLYELQRKGIIKEIKKQETHAIVEKTMPEYLKIYEGQYVFAGGIYKVEFKGNKLLLSFLGSKSPAMELIYTGYDKFCKKDGTMELSFAKENNGITYMKALTTSEIIGLGSISNEAYIGEKIQQNNISKEVAKAWTDRNEKQYLGLNMKYSSQIMVIAGGVKIAYDSDANSGYIWGNKIIDENLCRGQRQIPGNGSRDQFALKLYKEDNIEYLTYGNIVLAESKIAKSLPTKKFNCVIEKDGYNKWYKVPKELNGKKVTITVPENATVAVYSKDIQCISSYYIDKNNKITLKEDTYVLVAGDVGANIAFTYDK